jgi:hypothetical protein
MANVTATNSWPAGVYQYEVGDLLDGGPDSSEVLPIKQLANRSVYQRLANVTPWDDVLAGLHGYPAGACVMHAGKSWRSKAAANTAEPGTDALKWERGGYTLAELQQDHPTLESVINNTYIGPTPQKVRVFTADEVLADMATPGVNYTLQTIQVTGARRMRIFAHASFRNVSTAGSCTIGMSLRLDGQDAFGGHYLGAELPPRSGDNFTQIPISIMDTLSNLNPLTTYALTLVANKGQAVGPIQVKDSYIDVEYV